MRLSCKAQSMFEYCAVVVVIVAALMAMQAYMKRGLQGRWRDSVDQLGDQYDTSMSGSTTHTLHAKTSTLVVVAGGCTMRWDNDDTTEKKSGSMTGGL